MISTASFLFTGALNAMVFLLCMSPVVLVLREKCDALIPLPGVYFVNQRIVCTPCCYFSFFRASLRFCSILLHIITASNVSILEKWFGTLDCETSVLHPCSKSISLIRLEVDVHMRLRRSNVAHYKCYQIEVGQCVYVMKHHLSICSCHSIMLSHGM